MSHPFSLSLAELQAIELDFEDDLSDSEASQVGGGHIATTLALGEEGGWQPIPLPYPYPKPIPHYPIPYPIKPPTVTTLALGEEGGFPITQALYETGGSVITW
jgi:hypothetical protein